MLILTLLACQPADRFFVIDNFNPGIELSDDSVAGVYAAGSDLRFGVFEAAHWGKEANLRGFTLVSGDPDVIALSSVVSSVDTIDAEATAVGGGTTTLAVIDDAGNIVHEVAVEVAVPDAVALTSKLSIDVGSGFVASAPQKVLVGSYSAFEAEFSADGRSLAAHEVLGAMGGDAVAVEVEDSTLWEDREWLSIWPTLPGGQSVAVLAAGSELAEVQFDAVDITDIVGLQVLGNVTGAGADGTVVVGAVGIDSAGAMVLGVSPTWVLPDGTEWVGDELSYEPDASIAPVTLSLRFGAVETEVTIAGRPTGTLSSSTIGCASVGGSPAIWLGVAGVFAIAGRRRRSCPSGYQPAQGRSRPVPG